MVAKNFTQLIDTYLERVKYALELFREHKGIEDVMQWRSAGISRQGYLDDQKQIEYYFHGIGCYADTPQGPVDWDFGPNGRADGFDLWRLKVFVRENPEQFQCYSDPTSLEQDFASAIESGAIERHSEDKYGSLYYRAAT